MELDFNPSIMSTNTIDRYTQIGDGKRASFSKSFYYEGELTYEPGAIRENKKVFGLLHNAFKGFKIEALNKFRDLSRKEQIRMVQERKKQVLNALGEGSFFLKDKEYYSQKVVDRIDRIYSPHIKWARKKN